MALSTVAALLIVEVLLRVVGPTVADDPYISLGLVPSFFVKVQANGNPQYRSVQAPKGLFRMFEVAFSAKKAPGTVRIFCLGESASAGWPHKPPEIFSAYLEQALQRAFPDRRIELINASVIGHPAYRVRLVLEEVVRREPDLLVVWTGNNEFVERRTYRARRFPALAAALNHSVTFRLARATALGAPLLPGEHDQGPPAA